MKQCSGEHTRTYSGGEGLPVVTMCYHNPDTKRIQEIIQNQVSLIVCENHRDQYDFNTSPPLSHEAAEATMKDLRSEHMKTSDLISDLIIS